MAAEKFDAYQAVTDRIVELLEQGTVPWKKNWKDLGAHRNMVSKRRYTGINTWLLASSPAAQTPYWMTFNQIKEKGGTVKKGEKSTIVVFFRMLDTDTPAPTKRNPNAMKKIPFLRYYRLFNLSQTEGIEAPTETEVKEFEAIDEAEKILAATNARVTFGGDRAFYSPMTDEIGLPVPENFNTREDYYSTAFHEHVHWTGHDSRLKRNIMNGFGSEEYSKEELVAEMGAAFLCAAVGMEQPPIENSAAYVAGWLKRLTDPDNKRWLVSAGSQAQKAAEFILGQGDHDDEED
jgi:antirestriction protein ArdC